MPPFFNNTARKRHNRDNSKRCGCCTLSARLFRLRLQHTSSTSGVWIGIPNEDAVAFFADEVLPRIQEKVPDVQFSIVGGNPSARVQRLAEREGVVVTGRVPEIKPYFAEATVFVVPLRIGSGTRLKILEALAMGKAIVSTSVGAEGLDLKDGEEIFIADEPIAFADAVTRLLTDPTLRRRIGENGRARVEQDYDWRSIGEKLHTLYESLIKTD